jgi:hypothetical protein
MENRFYNLPEDLQLKIFSHARALLLTQGARATLLAQVHIELWTNRYDLWSCNGRIAFVEIRRESADFCEEVDSEDSYSVCDGECCGGKNESIWWSSR